MKVLSLFSGVGGFDMGLENAGMETVFQCEWDKHANSILHRHWPDVPKWDDVSTLTGKHILANAPVIDVVAWGSPCQDLSVAGKRAGLEGGRSGLFHEGIRIIKELQEESNGQYPRISIWENVVGALNSNRGADFGVILDEMAQAGALVIEWAVLDAQYFGVPQRRRRVFVAAIFDPVLASRCPNPLLPVAESLRGDTKKGKPKRQSAARTLTEGVGTDGAWWDGRDTAEALTTTSNEQRMPDKQRFQAVVEENVVGALAARDYKGVGNQYVAENKCVVEPYVKSSRAQTSEDSETWIPGEVNPTLNSFDVGDSRTTTAIVGSLQARDHKGTNHEGARDGKLIIEKPVAYHFDALSSNSMKSTNPDSGVNEVEQARTLDTWRPDPSLNQGGLAIVEPVLFENSYRDGARIANDGVSQTLTSKMGTGGGNTPMLAFDTQFGSNANVTEDVAPTLKSSQQSPSVAYPIDTRNALRDPEKYDAQNRQGLGIGNDGDPMATLTSAHVNGVAAQSESTMAVRRLTPLECERLMGWPDNHTLTKADGTTQADTHRYKQCGNGVASPVAQWIAKHLLNI
jgi:DNA (cytosine-5)-methyltransferase 1